MDLIPCFHQSKNSRLYPFFNATCFRRHICTSLEDRIGMVSCTISPRNKIGFQQEARLLAQAAANDVLSVVRATDSTSARCYLKMSICIPERLPKMPSVSHPGCLRVRDAAFGSLRIYARPPRNFGAASASRLGQFSGMPSRGSAQASASTVAGKRSNGSPSTIVKKRVYIESEFRTAVQATGFIGAHVSSLYWAKECLCSVKLRLQKESEGYLQVV